MPAATWLSSFPRCAGQPANGSAGSPPLDGLGTVQGFFFVAEVVMFDWIGPGNANGICMPILHVTGLQPEHIKPLADANGNAIHKSASVYGGKSKFLRRYRNLK